MNDTAITIAPASGVSAGTIAHTWHLVIKGTLTALAPLATSPPGGDKKGPQRLPRERLQVEGQWMEQVHLPGRGIRGKLRRCALAAVNGALMRSAGAPVLTVEDWFFNAVGGVKGAGEEDKSDLLEIRRRRLANPLASLFGSGQPWMSGKSAIGHAVPTVPLDPVVQAGIRSDDFLRDPGGLELLAPGEAERWLDMAVASSSRSRAKADGKTAERELRQARRNGDDGQAKTAEEKVRRSQEAIAGFDAKALASVSILMPLDGYEVIPRGTELSHEMRLAGVSAIELGLFLAGLRQFALDPRLGGHLAEGCGTVSARWTINTRRSVDRTFEAGGEIRIDPVDGLALDSDICAKALASWDDAETRIGDFDFRSPK